MSNIQKKDLKRYYSRSKRFAWTIGVAGFILSGYALHQDLGQAASAIFSTSVISAVSLYANKQHQDRKKLEAELQKQIDDA